MSLKGESETLPNVDRGNSLAMIRSFDSLHGGSCKDPLYQDAWNRDIVAHLARFLASASREKSLEEFVDTATLDFTSCTLLNSCRDFL